MKPTPFDDMLTPNQEIEIFSGRLKLISQDQGVKEIDAIGSVHFRWFPAKCVLFKARIIAVGLSFNPNDLGSPGQFCIQIPDSQEVPVFITRILHPYPPQEQGPPDAWIEGTFQDSFVQGDQVIKSSTFRFSIPNIYPYGSIELDRSTLRYYQILKLTGNETIEIIFDDQKSTRPESLFKMGGYLILATGTLTTKKRISLDDARIILDKLSFFLSFLEGRKVSPFFLQGILDDQIVWTDYSIRDAHPFQSVNNWPNEQLGKLQPLWNSFCEKWNQDTDRDFLKRGLKWYILANSNLNDPENSIIISQTALELIFNKFFVDSEVLTDTDDVGKLGAANKIRLVLNRIGVGALLPEGLHELRSLKSPKGAVEIVVNIRNSLVHSKVNAGKQLRQFSQSQKLEASQLLLHYLELSFLNYFNYNGMYNNRTVRTRQMAVEGELVPWATRFK